MANEQRNRVEKGGQPRQSPGQGQDQDRKADKGGQSGDDKNRQQKDQKERGAGQRGAGQQGRKS